MKNKRDEMYKRIHRHGQNLIALFALAPDTDPVVLCKQLRRIEHTAHRAAEAYCNGDLSTAGWEAFEAQALAKVDKLLGFTARQVPVFINGDPRGYALKIRDSYMREHQATLYRDMGGYGILAPDLND